MVVQYSMHIHVFFDFIGSHFVKPLLINGGTKNEDVLFLCQRQKMSHKKVKLN